MKKIIISLALVLIFSPFVQAKTLFEDVPNQSWYAPYVKQLNNEGVIDESSHFHPQNQVLRAELIKMTIVAIDELKNYHVPSYPAFDDVLLDQWFFPYVERAAKLGISMGYKDEKGNLLGIFGPLEGVNRAEASKMIVKAFNLEKEKDSICKSYSDVKKTDWFYDYLCIMSQNDIVSGYKNGKFGPADPVTRAQIAKMIGLAGIRAGIFEAEEVPENKKDENNSEKTENIEETDENSPKIEEKELFSANLQNIDPKILNTDSEENLVAKYTFKASKEGFKIETLTIVNDVIGDYFGDQAKGSSAIKKIVIKYPNKEGELNINEQSLGSDGKAKFSQLDFFTPAEKETNLEIYVQTNSIKDIGEEMSGEVFRLGLDNMSYDKQSFRAVGDITGTVISKPSSHLRFLNQEVASFTLRKSFPIFKMEMLESKLNNGDNDLIAFTVTANKSGSISLARLSFDLSIYDASHSDFQLSDFRFYRDKKNLNEVEIYDGDSHQDLKIGSTGLLSDGNAHVILSFMQEEIIPAGEIKEYLLKAKINHLDSNDSIHCRLSQNDEGNALTGLTAFGQENTGKIFVNADASVGLFTASNDFSASTLSSRNIIWSDRSAKYHAYPQFHSNLPDSDSGSFDWINGYLLQISSLANQELKQ